MRKMYLGEVFKGKGVIRGSRGVLIREVSYVERYLNERSILGREVS